MSLGPSGYVYLLDRAKEIKAEPRSAAIRATGEDKSTIQEHLLSYIDNTMERFQQRQQSQSCKAIYRSQAIKMPTARDTYSPDVEMKSVGSSHGQ